MYVALLRGINVGGKNKILMSDLKACFESLGFTHVQTYIQSGNVIFDSPEQPGTLTEKIEGTLPREFTLDSSVIKVMVIAADHLRGVVNDAPAGFGQEPDEYKYDVAFLKDLSVAEALEQFTPNPEVDTIWPGENVIYYRRLTSKLTKSRISRIIQKPIYQYMTVRNWNTTTKLLALSEN